MAEQDQPKTKAELLRELQSIQSLLNEQDSDAFPAQDDEDIPLLDEFIESDEVELLADDAYGEDETLAADTETLDALNAAYAALTGDLDDGTPQDTQNEKTPKPAERPQHQEQTAARTNAPPHTQQASQARAHAAPDAEPHPHEPEDTHHSAPAADLGAGAGIDKHTDPAVPAPLPGQQSLFDLPAKNAAALADAPALRPAQVKKASGENPFLPQHIRERLRGNQPLPKAEFKQPSTPPAHLDLNPYPQADTTSHAPASDDATPTACSDDSQRTQAADMPAAPISNEEVLALVDTLVADALPELAQRLREQLLAKLTQQDPTEH